MIIAEKRRPSFDKAQDERRIAIIEEFPFAQVLEARVPF
jgi:hypothetical protein